MPFLERIQPSLQVGLLDAVARDREGFRGPRLVDRVIGCGQGPAGHTGERPSGDGGVGADGRCVHDGSDTGSHRRFEDSGRPDHVGSPRRDPVAGGLEPPGEMDDRVGAGERLVEVVGPHVGGTPVEPGVVIGRRVRPRDAPSDPDDSLDLSFSEQGGDDGTSDVARGAGYDDAHADRPST
jgi:hypothetical protein